MARWRLVWLWAAFLLTLPLVNPYVRGDGNGYYAYVRSIVIDHDLQFENEYRHGDPAFQMVVFDEHGNIRPQMLLNPPYLRNQWAIGPAILWTPFFLAAHATVLVLNATGAEIPADGYSWLYRWLCACGTAIYGFAAVILGYRLALRYASRSAAMLAMLAIWIGTSLPVYMYFLPFHVPALSAFSVALFLTTCVSVRDHETPLRWLVCGLTAGLMIPVYYLNAIFLLVPAFTWVEAVVENRDFRPFKTSVIHGAYFVSATALALTPHFVIKAIIHGSPFRTGYEDRFFWLDPRLWQVGFSAEHGLFLWTPIVAIAVAGLLIWWRSDRLIAGSALGAFAVFYYVVASYQNWHGQSSFGSRFFVSFTPLFVVGTSLFVERLSHRWAPAAVLSVLMLWNAGFVFQWGTKIVPNRGPVSFIEVARNQVTVVPERLGVFAKRYLVDRSAVTREIEQIDLRNREAYDLQR